MSNLVDYAKRELELAGYFKEDSFYRGWLGKAILDLIEKFSEQNHSGMSANLAISVFERLARHEPLRPLTGADDEWREQAPGTFQNVRCSHVFKENGQAYDIGAGSVLYGYAGQISRDPDGNCEDIPVTFVTFPYTPIPIINNCASKNARA